MGTALVRILAGIVVLPFSLAFYTTPDPAKPSESKLSVYSGSPFFDDNYKYADIIFSRGRKMLNVKTKINLELQQVQFLSFNSVEALIDPGMVKEVSYADTSSEGIIFYKFRTGFPAVEGKGRNNFYIVLADGNCSFLRSVEKKVIETRNVIDTKLMKDYETYDVFYLLVKGEMKRLKKEKEFLLAELSDKQTQLEAFIGENKLSMRSIEHIAKLVNYYNTL
jgi:hypothetical protein